MDLRTFIFMSLLVLPPIYYALASYREGQRFREERKRSKKMEIVDTIIVIVLIILLITMLIMVGIGLYILPL